MFSLFSDKLSKQNEPTKKILLTYNLKYYRQWKVVFFKFKTLVKTNSFH